jgi:16S rRNA (adenine1518-N6/adenine1519-N6)-dimethyltransferase
MRRVLVERDIRLTKSLGQNFLHDGNQLRRIIELSELAPADRVLEVGPGLGPLTEQLLARAGEVLAIEKDERLVAFLRERFGEDKRLTLLSADALEFLKKHPRDWNGWKLISTLPYSVASPILVELALSPTGPERMVATLQEEVARRLMASPGGPDFGLLTLLVQLDYAPGEWFKIPAGCFFPEPDVGSACVCLVRRREPLLADAAGRVTFVKVVKRGFSQRRKKLRKLLRQDWPDELLDQAFQAIHPLRDDVRAESLTLQQFATLAAFLSRHAP